MEIKLVTRGVAAVSIVAIIPARGGSKGIPGKNLQVVGGVSLVARSILSANQSTLIDSVFVSTDDSEISSEARRYGAKVIERPAKHATDKASSESVLLHALKKIPREVEILVFLQCTSPFIDVDALDVAISKVQSGEYDSVFSAQESYDFIWSVNKHQEVKGLNHDENRRFRRQERSPSLVETGAFYVLNAKKFKKIEHRFFGKIGAQIVNEFHAIEIDTPAQLRLAQLIAQIQPSSIPFDPRTIKGVIFDFDGIHTDDSVYVNENGVESVRVLRKDGLGISKLRSAGREILILSSEVNPVVSARAEKLRVDCRQGIAQKGEEVRKWLQEKKLSRDEVLYVGNDINDIPAMQEVRWPIAVADAHPDVLSHVCYVTQHKGGEGAVREICDLLYREPLEET